MRNQAELVSHLRQSGVLRSKMLIDAFLTIDRADFIPDPLSLQAYEDHPLPIGYGQTISQPFTVAFMLEALQIRQNDLVMDIGAGSGWTTALMATMAKQVIGLDRIKELVTFANSNLTKYSFQNAIVLNAGSQLGIPQMQFDKILVSAAAHTFPSTLLDQLKPDGTLVIPVANAIIVCHKDKNGHVRHHQFDGFVFVPLITSDN
ncbi:MAG: protein-L-isoaspartate O-methyltransferase [Campylobacterota bacterium]|nr:protein-L-isoaspartate O-methyltransferase [Campylobacterota bacterium]